MPYFLHDLRVQLQEKRNRLYKADRHSYSYELIALNNFFETPTIQNIVNVLEAATDTSFEEWKKTSIGWQNISFPRSEKERAKLCYLLSKECALSDDPATTALNYAHNISSAKAYDDILAKFTEMFVDPIVNYIHDNLDNGGSLLYVLEKYKHKAEWFDKRYLFDLYKNDEARGEANLDKHMREYLHDQGIDYPFSSPQSPSGKADIVAGLGTLEPLVLENKIFDLNKGYDRGYIKKGLRQVFDYSNDYNQPIGYVVIFNMTEKNIVIETKNKDWPPRLIYGNKTFFFITIDLFLHELPTSKRGKIEPYIITEQELISE